MITPKYGLDWFETVYCAKCSKRCIKSLDKIKICAEIEKFRESKELTESLNNIKNSIDQNNELFEEFKEYQDLRPILSGVKKSFEEFNKLFEEFKDVVEEK